jgi:hypothetical protein
MTIEGRIDFKRTNVSKNIKNNKKGLGYFVTIIFLLSTMSGIIQIYAEPVITEDDWSDTFNNALGIESSYNVNLSNGDIKLKGYYNDFEDETLGQIPDGWTREYADAGSGFNRHVVADNPYEPTKSLYMLCNNDLGSFAWQRLWRQYSEYFQEFVFELTLKDISVNTNRQGYFYIEFYNASDMVYHEVRYYWDDGRSGIPVNSSSLTTNDLVEPLPTGTGLGIKYFISENISEDIDDNTFADLTSVIDNITKVRYGFYQDAAPGADAWEQVYIDNIGIFNDIFGYARSTEIILSPNKVLKNLIITKTEPIMDTKVEISILNSTTNESIPGFDNLLGSLIDISTINRLIYPLIRLQANLIGTGNTTPVLHDWRITWVNATPPETPKGFAVSNPLNGYSLILSWNSNTEPDLAHYRLYYSLDNISFSWLTDVAPGTISFIHYGLTEGVTYYYKISAVDTEYSPSPISEVVDGTPDIDSDLDGIGNIPDSDDDNDGILDISDPYPLNPVNDMETTVDEIKSILDNLNLTALLDAISYLNQTLPSKIDNLSLQLTDVNDSIQNSLLDVSLKLGDINSSLSNQLTSLLNNLTTDHNALRNWFDLVLDELDNNLTATRNTLESQISNLNSTINEFYLNLDGELGNIISSLITHDTETGENHSDIITILNDLLNNDDLQSLELSSLKTLLTNLAMDISEYNESIANDILQVAGDIDEFSPKTDDQVEDIENTLGDLAKLEDIISDLAELDQSLQNVNDDLKDSIEDESKEEEIEDRVKFVEMLIILVIILLIVNLIFTLVMGLRKQKGKEDNIRKERVREDTQHLSEPKDTSTLENETIKKESTQIENGEFPLPPPPTE